MRKKPNATVISPTHIPPHSCHDPRLSLGGQIQESSHDPHALQEKKQEATGVLGSLMMTAGMSAAGNCGVGFNEVGSPMFEYAMRVYGEHLGTVVMERSLDFLDLPME